jgi:hypothetical protein
LTATGPSPDFLFANSNLTFNGNVLTVSADVSANRVLTANGTVSVPSYTFTTDVSSGTYLPATSTIGMTTAGVERTRVDLSGLRIMNGTIRNLAGSVSAPSYTFFNDLSMGLYDPASNVLGFVTSGVERMRVDSNGNVGIGTSGIVTPLNYMLNIRGTGGSNGFISFYSATNNNSPFVGFGFDETIDAISFRGNTGTLDLNSNWMTIKRTTGNVGIGTSNPNTNLEVYQGGTGVTCALRLSAGLNGSVSTANVSKIDFFTQGGGGGTVSNTIQQQILNPSQYGLNFMTGSTSLMAIQNNGNVGIGTSPTVRLDVVGAIRGTKSIVGYEYYLTTSNFSIPSSTNRTLISDSYTYLQPNVAKTLVIFGGYESAKFSGGTGYDNVNFRLTCTDQPSGLGSNIQSPIGFQDTYYNNQFRGTTHRNPLILSIPGSGTAVSFSLTIFAQSSDDTFEITNPFVIVHELSSLR